jgi:hypothetical protein
MILVMVAFCCVSTVSRIKHKGNNLRRRPMNLNMRKTTTTISLIIRIRVNKE